MAEDIELPGVDQKPKQVSDLSKEERATIRTAESAEAFLKSEFGKFVFSVYDSYIKGKEAELYRPLEPGSGFDGIGYALRAESSKGAIMGLRLAKAAFEGMVEQGKLVRLGRGLEKSAGED